MKAALEEIVAYLKAVAGETSMASVQINSSGNCILREGGSQGEMLSVDQFTERLADFAATGEI